MREAAEGKSKMLMLIARVNSNYDVKASYFAVRSDLGQTSKYHFRRHLRRSEHDLD
jgi:hypothetical protein